MEETYSHASEAPLVRSPKKLEGTDSQHPGINPPHSEAKMGRAGVGLPAGLRSLSRIYYISNS
jgi:hypothetical protein